MLGVSKQAAQRKYGDKISKLHGDHSVVVECLIAGSGVHLGRASVEQCAAARHSMTSVGAGHEGDGSFELHGGSPGETGATVGAGEAVTAPVT
jgi:hypothetical protein